MPDAPTPAAQDPATQPEALPRDPGAGSEKYKARGVALRVVVYVIAGHFFAGFLWLLFYLGANSHK
ncbi:DUF6126 family protein [Actinacidiphila bryophytorum]|uniref:Small hydrophobic protein n=1 Tax=Actinacidiphila bryophytorum TaxID=1436133 RepID=A0A9W4E5I2_9ACTN|nr:DUF6126 family protein [Actinacidiphila bryophytorum]MBM9437916.1 hypothetical protein [Actinacidiphila bryophytorum]CAG7623299.1 conserved hypothetical protein [Actinacidiphila bryophytorum]